jgi:hypothetical protein
MSGIHESLGNLAVQTRKSNVEARTEDKTILVRCEIHLSINGPVSRKGELLLAGDKLQGAEEAG